MPVLAVVNGVTITMYYDDHVPPHFHARYGEYQATFTIDGMLLEGALPRATRRMIAEWARRHREELALNWSYAIGQESFQRIEGK
jgi:hypothetical protein